jgi:hypothetical protein
MKFDNMRLRTKSLIPLAAMYVARASREAMMAPYSAFGALIFESDSPDGRTAQADFPVEIALQTNLLALNAGVEAAHGEARQGAASRWWSPRSGRWRCARPTRPGRSARWCATPARRSTAACSSPASPAARWSGSSRRSRASTAWSPA